MILESLLFGAIITALTQILKKWIKPKFGTAGVLIVVIILSAVVALVRWYSQFLPAEFIQSVLQIVAYAVAVYEIIVKRIGSLFEPKVVEGFREE